MLLYIILHRFDFVKDIEPFVAAVWAEPGGAGEDDRGAFFDLRGEIFEEADDEVATFVLLGLKFDVFGDFGHGGAEVGFADDGGDGLLPEMARRVAEFNRVIL